jgi:RHS repeat-associated protein
METQQGYKTKNRTGNETGDDVAKTYNFGYNYVETRPHILDAIDVGGGLTRNYANDASGNNTGYQLDYGGYMINVTIDWDEEDRIKQYTFVTPGGISNEYYWYDNEVQRMIKRRVASGSGNSISNETLYPSQYYSVYIDDTSDEIIMRTKNVYVGNQRVVSVLNPDEQTRYEYYYHTDHLGSTTYLTDRDGKLKEHIEYTPWGEGWIEQSQSFPTDYLPYKFTGKELDSTGLYYYGARYYDPRISMWLSADPALGRYLDAVEKANEQNSEMQLFSSRNSGQDGLLDSKNMSLYTYAHQNPFIYVDPNGLWAFSVDAYLGYGLGLTIGQSENKDYFCSLRVGFGLGMGFIFDPKANQPAYTGTGIKYQTLSLKLFGGVLLGPIEYEKVYEKGVINPKFINEDEIIKFSYDRFFKNVLKPEFNLEDIKINLNIFEVFKFKIGGAITTEYSTTLKEDYLNLNKDNYE